MLRRHELLRRIRRKPSFSVRPLDGRRVVVKELMRRIAQSALGRDAGKSTSSADIDEALDDKLSGGGRLNVTLLGGAREMPAR
jgi:hypothetical protein